MDKTYSVLYKDGTSQLVTGTIILFSVYKTDIPRFKHAVYLNASEVVSITPQKEEV